jgi:hypothetical protein
MDNLMKIVLGSLLVLTFVLIFIIAGVIPISHHVGSFSNPNDSGYSYRYQAGPDGVSLNDRMVAAQAKAQPQANVSGLTGSRDVPVFFQDYDYDMQVKGGNIYNRREGFAGAEEDCGIPGGCHK